MCFTIFLFIVFAQEHWLYQTQIRLEWLYLHNDITWKSAYLKFWWAALGMFAGCYEMIALYGMLSEDADYKNISIYFN